MFSVGNIFGVGARLQARRIDETLKDFIASLFVATTTTDLADAGNLSMTSYVDRWKPELDACLELVFYALANSHKASPGMKAFGFSYSKKGSPIALVLCIVCKWLYCRLHRISVHKRWREATAGSVQKKLWRLLKLLDAVVQVMSFANHLSFFSTKATSETYPDLTSRVSGYGWAPLSLPLSTNSDISSRSRGKGVATCGHGIGRGDIGSVSIDSEGTDRVLRGVGARRAEGQQVTRHVAWQAVQGLVLSLTLLMNWHRLGVNVRRYAIDLYYRATTLYNSVLNQKYIPDVLLQFLKPTKNSSPRCRGSAHSHAGDGGSASNDDSDACAICGLQAPEAPHAGECGHVCCFHCLSTNVLIGRFRCPTCGLLLTCCNRV